MVECAPLKYVSVKVLSMFICLPILYCNNFFGYLNAEFQRIARRDKKAFFSDQCKEIEENNRIGKTRELFKKLEIPRENFMQRWAQQRTEMVWT